MKVRDLITVPDVETVIQLTKVLDEDKSKLVSLIETFVVTDDIFKNFNKLFQPIISNEGAGYFLKGSYGSGKSHFLSVISLLFKYPYMWDFIVKQNKSFTDIEKKITQKKYFVINVPMLLYREEEKFEQAILKSAELELTRQNINMSLSDAKRIVEDFFKYTSDKVQDDFNKYIGSNKINNFDSISIEQQAVLIKKFILNTGIPFTFTYDRATVFDNLMQILKNYNYDGIIILIDELSEFLSSKNSNTALDEDIRFLQFLGEFTLNNPVWVVCAIQEEIKDISNISNKIFTKIKDRYKNRLELTTLHIGELIEKRLIKKNNTAEKILKELHRKITDNFKFLHFDFKNFYSLYPLTNPTIVLLQSITNIFSKQRGIVDFIHYQIKGDEKRNIKGILDKDYFTLITADLIFDHFEHNIQEFIDTNQYYEKVYKYYKLNIPKIFKTKEEQKLALRLIKLLILIHIAPSINSQSVKSLTHMLMYIYSETDSILNYEYIYNNIIKKFINNMDYVVESKKENFYDNIISINISININQVLNNKLKLYAGNLSEKKDIVINTSLKFSNIQFLDVESWLDNIYEKNTYFQNTQRNGYITMTNLRMFTEDTLNEYGNIIEEKEKDFFIIIGTPIVDENIINKIKNILQKYNKPEQKNFIIWIPEGLSEYDINILNEFYTHKKLMDEYKNDNSPQAENIKKILKNKFEILLLKTEKIFTDKYINGNLITYKETIPAQLNVIAKSKDEIIEKFADIILTNKHPLHYRIKPDTARYNMFQMTTCIKTFFKAGEMKYTELDVNGLRTVVDGILLPLKIVYKKEGIYYLKPIPEKSKFLLDYLFLIPKQGISFKELYKIFKNNEYGITKLLFLFITAALSAAGMVVARKNNKTIYFDKINLVDINSIDTLFPGEIIDFDIQNKISQLNFLQVNFKDNVVTLHSQNKMWDQIVELKKNIYPKFIKLEATLKDYESYTFFKNKNLLKNIYNKLKYCIDVFNSIKVSYNSKNGLENFISNIDDVEYFNESFVFVNNATTFFQNYINTYLLFINYINNVFIPESFPELIHLKNELSEILNDFEEVLNSDFQKIQEKFYLFQEKFIAIYIDEHNKFYNNIEFNKVADIKNYDTYILLDRLGKLKYLTVENDILLIENLINSILRKKCKSVNIEKLKGSITPKCDCGYELGAKSFKFNTTEIFSKIKKGILEYITELQNIEYIEKLSIHITGLRQINKNDVADAIEKILKLDLNIDFSKLIIHLKNLLTFETIEEINKAIEGNTVLISRDINEFIDKIVNKNISKNKLFKIFTDWLTDFGKTELSENTFISITDIKNIDLPDNVINDIKSILEVDDVLLSVKILIYVNWLYGHNLEVEKNILFLSGIKINKNIIGKLLDIYNKNKDKIIISKFLTDNEIKKLIDIINIEEQNIKNLVNFFNNEVIFNEVRIVLAKKIINIVIDKKISGDDLIINKENNLLPDTTEAILTAVKLNNLFIKLKETKPLNDIYVWVDEVYKNNLSIYEILITKFSNFNIKYDLISSEKFNTFRKEIEKEIKKQEDIFDTLFKNTEGLSTTENWHKKVNKESKPGIFVFDGLRWDLWLELKKILEENNISIYKEEYIFALPPTETFRQRYALFHGRYDENIKEEDANTPTVFGSNAVWINCAEYDYKRDVINEKIQENETVILGINFIDDMMHNNKFDLPTFYDEIKLIFKEKIIDLFNIFKDRKIYLITDHGFKSQPNWHRKGEYRFTHGGDSPYEVIIPSIVLKYS